MGIFSTATAIWPEHNPLVDDQFVDAIALGACSSAPAETSVWGRGWEDTALVTRLPILM